MNTHDVKDSLEDNGDRSKGITRHTFDAKVSKEDLAGTYFPAFKQAVRGGNAKGVMVSECHSHTVTVSVTVTLASTATTTTTTTN